MHRASWSAAASAVQMCCFLTSLFRILNSDLPQWHKLATWGSDVPAAPVSLWAQICDFLCGLYCDYSYLSLLYCLVMTSSNTDCTIKQLVFWRGTSMLPYCVRVWKEGKCLQDPSPLPQPLGHHCPMTFTMSVKTSTSFSHCSRIFAAAFSCLRFLQEYLFFISWPTYSLNTWKCKWLTKTCV